MARWSRRRRWLTGVLAVVVLLCLVAVVAVHLAFPRNFLPAPTGGHPIGSTTWQVVDTSRPEVFTEPGHRRTLTVQAWYPARPGSHGPVQHYLPDASTFAPMLAYAHAPSWTLDYLASAPTHAQVDVPVADGRFPVVFFATGNMGYRSSNTVQVEELASHGFIVVTFDQPGTVGSATLADGRRIPYAGSDVVRPLVDRSLVEPPSTVPTLRGVPYPDGIAGYLAADPASILDHLAAHDGPAWLLPHADLARVGAFGISLGGVTVSQWCATDARLKACLMMDAPMTRQALSRGLRAPAAWLTRPAGDMRAEGWPDLEVRRNAGSERTLFEHTTQPSWYVEIRGGRKHADLTDAPFGSRVFSALGLTSSGDGSHVHDVMRTVTRDFFEHTLAGVHGAGVLDASPWSDVAVTRRA